MTWRMIIEVSLQFLQWFSWHIWFSRDMAFHVAGIDPGKQGGWSVWDRPSGVLVEAGPLVFDDPGALYDTFMRYDVRVILLERAQSAAGQGNVFEYGRGFGRTEAACMMTPATILYTSPGWWKGKMNCPVDKEEARQKTLRDIPGMDKFVTLKKHDGIAEAALIGKLLTIRKFVDDLTKNNAVRNKPKRKRPSYRL